MPNTPIIVAKDQDDRTGLVETLIKRYNTPAIRAGVGELPVDVVWSALGTPIMGDLKKPEDLIKSALDGRLHEQTQAMKDAKALGFLLIEGQWSKDGISVGYKDYAWTWDQFCNLLMSIQAENIKLDFSFNAEHSARRLAALYKWTEKEKRGSWHEPAKLLPPSRNFLDKGYRNQVGMLMHLPLMGAERAELLMDSFGFMGSLGITDEGLRQAADNWKKLKGVGKKLPIQWEEFLRG